MFFSIFTDSPIVAFAIIPALIFFARIIDVTFGTLRIIYLMKGEKVRAALFGFIESLIWLVAIGQIIQNVTNAPAYIAWAAGFASGNYVGLLIEERLAVGKLIVRVITQTDATSLIDRLKTSGYGITHIDAHGSSGKVKLLFSVIKRDKLGEIIDIIKKQNPKAFYTIEDVRTAHEGVYPHSGGIYARVGFFNLLKFLKRK